MTNIRCDECVATMINGVLCHEQGCPNRPEVRRCYNCGDDFEVPFKSHSIYCQGCVEEGCGEEE